MKNVKNLLMITLLMSGTALLWFLQKYSKEYYASFAQPEIPVVDISVSGLRAPDFALTDLEGRTFQLADVRGNVVALIFWTTW